MLRKYSSERGVVFSSFLGLGDQIVCSPIYRTLAQSYPLVIVPSNRRYSATIKNLLKDQSNIVVEVFPELISHSGQLVQRIFLERFGFEGIPLGRFAPGFLSLPGVRADQYFYKQANVDFEARWNKFHFQRDFEREKKLLRHLKIDDEPYAFVHQDRIRKMSIDEKFLNRNLKVIEPDVSLRGVQILDYIGIIEGASEIHCIESSFSALIESLQIEVPKFIHRYARVKVALNPSNEFTYRSGWEIIRKD